MTEPQTELQDTPEKKRNLRTWLIAGAAVVGVGLMVAVFAGRFGEDPRLVDSPLIGEELAPMTLDRLDGSGPLSLDEFQGKVVVVNFWASWCVPSCRDEHPHLISTAAAYGDAVQFIGVVFQDEPEPASRFLDQLGWGSGYEYVLDPGSRAAVEFGVFGVPETFFLNREGLLVDKIAGPVTTTSLTEAIEAILAAG
jgi:cytochrome c biogenesis protein CcmG/thiol:disulfide interchange protein DsbE